MLADLTHLAAQLAHQLHRGMGLADEVLGQPVDAEHAQHAGTAQQAQQAQYHANGADHSQADREEPHERVNIHHRFLVVCSPRRATLP